MVFILPTVFNGQTDMLILWVPLDGVMLVDLVCVTLCLTVSVMSAAHYSCPFDICFVYVLLRNMSYAFFYKIILPV